MAIDYLAKKTYHFKGPKNLLGSSFLLIQTFFPFLLLHLLKSNSLRLVSLIKKQVLKLTNFKWQ